MNKILKFFLKSLLAFSCLLNATHKKKQAIMCVICYEEVRKKTFKYGKDSFYKVTKQVKKLSCHHTFHEQCIKEWYLSDNQNSNKCPVCRTEYTLPLQKHKLLCASQCNPDILTLIVPASVMGIGAIFYLYSMAKNWFYSMI